jgi:type IV pilus biogenesis protein CpaD/CtpE
VVDFAPGRVRVYSKSREKLRAIAASWKMHSDWSVITVRGFAGASARMQVENAALAQRRAEKIRSYLIRYGVPPGLVVATRQRTVPGKAAATVELSIERCASAAPCARFANSTSTARL